MGEVASSRMPLKCARVASTRIRRFRSYKERGADDDVMFRVTCFDFLHFQVP